MASTLLNCVLIFTGFIVTMVISYVVGTWVGEIRAEKRAIDRQKRLVE